MKKPPSLLSSTKHRAKGQKKEHTIVKKFLEGLSHQIPDDSLEFFLKNDSSLSLILESSFDALPTNGAIRKLIGANFDACLGVLKAEIQTRFDVLVENQKKEIKEEENRAENINQCTTSIAIFSSTDYDRALSRNDRSLLPLLGCTNYATPYILHKIRSGNLSETSKLKSMVTTFRSAAFSGLVSSGNLITYIKSFLTALKELSSVDKVNLVTILRDFLYIHNVMISMNSISLKDQLNDAAFGLGEIWGYYIELAVSYPVEYYQSILTLQNNSDSDSSSSESDEDINPKVNKAKALSEAIKYIVVNLSAFFIQYRSKGACIFIGMMNSLESNKLQPTMSDSKINDASRRRRYDTIAKIILTGLSNSRVLTKKEIPSSKIVANGEKRLKIVTLEWAKKNIPNSNTRDEKNLLREMEAKTFDASTREGDFNSDDSQDDSEENDSENNSSVEEVEEDKPLFILDSNRIDDIEIQKGEEVDIKSSETGDNKSSESSSEDSRGDNEEIESGNEPKKRKPLFILDSNPVHNIENDEQRCKDNDSITNNVEESSKMKSEDNSHINIVENLSVENNEEETPVPVLNSNSVVDEAEKDEDNHIQSAEEKNTKFSEIINDEEKNENESHVDNLSSDENEISARSKKTKKKSVKMIPALGTVMELKPIPEDDIVTEMESPNKDGDNLEKTPRRTRRTTRTKRLQEDSTSNTDSVASITTPQRRRSRSSSIALSLSESESCSTTTPTRRSTRRRRSTIDTQQDDASVNSDKSDQKTPNRTSAKKPKCQTRTSNKKQDDTSPVDVGVTSQPTPLRRSRRIRSNSESSTSVY